MKLTKKEFLKKCSVHKYTGQNMYINAVFYDWQVTENSRGFKWIIFSKELPKNILLNYAYKIIVLDDLNYPWFVNVKNDKLYKVPLCGSGLLKN